MDTFIQITIFHTHFIDKKTTSEMEIKDSEGENFGDMLKICQIHKCFCYTVFQKSMGTHFEGCINIYILHHTNLSKILSIMATVKDAIAKLNFEHLKLCCVTLLGSLITKMKSCLLCN